MDFAADDHKPVYPKQHSVDGYEPVGVHASVAPLNAQPGKQPKERTSEETFQDAVRAQYDAEMNEVRHPTRLYY